MLNCTQLSPTRRKRRPMQAAKLVFDWLCLSMRIQGALHASMRGAGSVFSSRLAIHPIRALHNVPVPRIVRLPKAGDAVEVGTKIARWDRDEFPQREVIAPGIAIDSLTSGSRRWLRGGGSRCRCRSDENGGRWGWFERWPGRWGWCR